MNNMVDITLTTTESQGIVVVEPIVSDEPVQAISQSVVQITQKHPGGRPTEYNEDILTKSREYISACVDEIEEYHKTRGDKSDSYDRIVRVKIPTIEGLAVYLNVSRSTLYLWKEEQKEFSDIIDELQAIQADRLLNNGLSGDYNPTIAKVLLTKHGYREGIENTGKDGGAMEIASDDIKNLADQLNALNKS